MIRLQKFVHFILFIIIAPLFFFLYLVIILILFFKAKSTSPALVWGCEPIISHKYFSNAMKKAGYSSVTLMNGFFHISKESDFDLLFKDFISSSNKSLNYILRIFNYYFLFLYSILKFDIFHIPAQGFVLRYTFLKYWEAQLLKAAGKKTVVLPYGGDFYRYSRIVDTSLRHAILKSYPDAAKKENYISKQYNYWSRHADFIITGVQVDGTPRWDMLPFSYITIDTNEWQPKEKFNVKNGRDGVVKIMHTPNHRGFKGTEFILDAVETLKKEGLLVELILIEKMPNEAVRLVMNEEADILAEQIIFNGYALSGIEGMASELAVVSNLSDPYYTQLFRRYSYLNECPILSTTPETVTENLRVLVTQPQLRIELAKAGRQYVLKYHSAKTAQFMFETIYSKIWNNEDINTLDVFHPLLKDSYNNQSPIINTPLIKNNIPLEYFKSI